MRIRTWERIARENRGGVTMLAAGGIMTLLGCTAFAVDLGSLYMDSRKLQGIADAAALAAAADIANPQAAAEQAVAANGWDRKVSVAVETGNYRFDPAITAGSRFASGGAAPDAVRVTLRADSPVYFARALIRQDKMQIGRKATAARAKHASFSIGSRLAAINGGLVGQYLNQLTGTSLNLSVMDYNALLNANVDLLQFSEALATRIDAQALSFDDVLDTQVATPKVLGAMGDALRLQGNNNAADAVESLAQQITAKQIAVGDIIDLGPYGAQDKVSTDAKIKANGYEFVRTILELASGTHQVELDLGASIPGLLSTKARIAIGQRPQNSPWLTVTDRGETIVRTAQTRIYVEAGTPATGLLASLASLKLPVMIELASAEAKLSDIKCGSGQQGPSVDLDVRPSVGTAKIAEFNAADFGNFSKPLGGQPATIAKVLLISVKGSAEANLGGNQWQKISFNASEIAANGAKTVSTNDIVSGLVSSLVSKLKLTIDPSLLTLTLQGPIGNQLKPLATPLDGLLNTLTDIVGAKLGQADVRINGVRCGVPALVA